MNKNKSKIYNIATNPANAYCLYILNTEKFIKCKTHLHLLLLSHHDLHQRLEDY